jgi:hypothetical protein
MRKLQLVLENVRDRHMINILEEGVTELGVLKTKKFLNENLSVISKILVEEGVVDGARNHLANNWGTYAAGAGGAAAGTVAAGLVNPEAAGNAVDFLKDPSSYENGMADPTMAGMNTQDAFQNAQNKIVDAYGNAVDHAPMYGALAGAGLGAYAANRYRK